MDELKKIGAGISIYGESGVVAQWPTGWTREQAQRVADAIAEARRGIQSERVREAFLFIVEG